MLHGYISVPEIFAVFFPQVAAIAEKIQTKAWQPWGCDRGMNHPWLGMVCT